MKTGNRIVFLANQQNAERFMYEIEDVPWKELMQFQVWRQQYKQFLKPEENVDFLGTQGNFKMKDTFGLALLIEGGFNPEFKIRMNSHLTNLDENFDHFNVRNQIFIVLSNFFSDKIKQRPIDDKSTHYSSITQSLVDPVILKQGHLDQEPNDLEMKDLFILLRNLNDHGPRTIELMANEYLAESKNSKVKTLDELFKNAD